VTYVGSFNVPVAINGRANIIGAATMGTATGIGTGTTTGIGISGSG